MRIGFSVMKYPDLNTIIYPSTIFLREKEDVIKIVRHTWKH